MLRERLVPQKAPLPLLPFEKQQEDSDYDPGSGPSSDVEFASVLVFDFPDPRTVRNNVYCLGSSIYDILLQQSVQTKTSVIMVHALPLFPHLSRFLSLLLAPFSFMPFPCEGKNGIDGLKMITSQLSNSGRERSPFPNS